MDERTLRLQERFKVIRQAIAETSSKDIAYATSCVAWLEVIEYWCLQAFRKIEHDCLGRSAPDFDSIRPELHQEIKHLLKAFHEDLCEHLGLDQLDIINRSGSFKEIVDDICNERG